MDTFKPNSLSATRRKTAKRALAALLMTLVGVGSFSGCNAMNGARDSWAYNGGWNSMMMKYRNDAWANKAWHRRKHQFCSEKHFHEFCEGFRAGYAGVADGGTGCNPPFPPRQYWSWKYQSGQGQEKVSAWFAGYPHGARAAEEDGIGNWTQIQTSTTVQNQLAQQGKLGPGQTPGMYPMPAAMPIAADLAKKRTAAGNTAAIPEKDTAVMADAGRESLNTSTFQPHSEFGSDPARMIFTKPIADAESTMPVLSPIASPIQ